VKEYGFDKPIAGGKRKEARDREVSEENRDGNLIVQP
jgi:hypothetical protein